MADFDRSYTHPVQQFIYAVEEGRCDYAAELCNISGYGPEGFLHLLHKRHDSINEKYRLTTNGGESFYFNASLHEPFGEEIVINISFCYSRNKLDDCSGYCQSAKALSRIDILLYIFIRAFAEF
jgi:hypothetical protein